MGDLYSKLCELETLFDAWKHVKSKNSAGGIDGFSVLTFEDNLRENLEQLQKDLQSGSWIPDPYLRLEIKKNETEKRKLGLLSIKDKIVQQAIKTLIEPRFEKVFLSNSYGYRPERGSFKAIRRSENEMRQPKNKWVLKLDIDNYFDTINHEVLFSRLQQIIPDEEIIRLIELSVKMGAVTRRMKWNDVVEGIPQGAMLSPLLANFYLHSFDQFVLNYTNAYIRYADDFIILTATEEEAHILAEKATAYLSTRLKLKLNRPVIDETKNGIEFLGVVLHPHLVSISDKKRKKLFDRIDSIEIDGGKLTVKSIETLEGIKQYYARLLPQTTLWPLDEHLIEKLNELIRIHCRSISGKKSLESLLREVPFFSTRSELNRKKQIAVWLDLYSEQKRHLAHQTVADKNKKLIQQKKREYRKKENENTELVVATPGSFIAKNNKGICIKLKGKQIDKQPLNALKHISVMASGVSISNGAIQYCMEQKIPVDFFDYSGKLYASILSPVFVEHTLWQRQASMPLDQRAYLAACIVRGKLKNQQNLIKYFHKYHKEETELSKYYDEAIEKINSLVEKTKHIDIHNEEYAEVLMSYESAGAIAYWAYIRQLLIDDNVDFEARIRRGATDLLNSLLNYGYAIVYARIWQALLAAKLNPGIGLLHADQKDKPTLAFDLIELFRAQAVDRIVIGLVQKREPVEVEDDLLSENTKKLLIQNILERLNRYEKYRGEEMTFSSVIKQQARELARFVAGDEKVFKPYIAKW